MELGELFRKITAMRHATQTRLNAEGSEPRQHYVQGFCDGLDSVIVILKKAIEAERTRQRLAKLESELAQDPEPAWPDQISHSSSAVPRGSALPMPTTDAAAPTSTGFDRQVT